MKELQIVKFNIKSDNYQDYQNKVKEAAKKLYDMGKISSGNLEEILNSNLELPYIANDKYEYYSIDTAPGFCIEWMVKALKYDIEKLPKEKRNYFKATLENKEDGTWFSKDIEFTYEKLRFIRKSGFDSIPKKTIDKINQAMSSAINNMIWESLFRK